MYYCIVTLAWGDALKDAEQFETKGHGSAWAFIVGGAETTSVEPSHFYSRCIYMFENAMQPL